MHLGDPLDNEQVDACFKDCMPEENDDGEIKYVREYSSKRNLLHRFHFQIVHET